MIGNPDRRLNAQPLCESGAITYPKPRRSVGRIVRSYWLQAVAFVVFLVVWFLFWAVNVPGV